jgi:hypothetical protein
MRCAECGHETPEASQGQATVRVLGDAGWREVVPAQLCPWCGATVSRRRSVRAQPPGGPADVITTRKPTDQRAGPRLSRRSTWVMALTLVVVVGVAFAIGLAATPPPQRQLTGHQLQYDQLRPGDCLTGSNMALGTGGQWPELVTAVPCTRTHLAEVYFAANYWPQSLTTYPGYKAVFNQALDRCLLAFNAYDGIPSSLSSFSIVYMAPPGSSDWASGDRRVVCVAYPTGRTPVKYSIKGSYQ